MAISKTQIKITIIKMENKKRTTNLNQIVPKPSGCWLRIGNLLDICVHSSDLYFYTVGRILVGLITVQCN